MPDDERDYKDWLQSREIDTALATIEAAQDEYDAMVHRLNDALADRDRLAARVRELEAALVREWISADDGLPEPLKSVLVTAHGVVNTGFISSTGEWRGKLRGPYTHWMPEPLPPVALADSSGPAEQEA